MTEVIYKDYKHDRNVRDGLNWKLAPRNVQMQQFFIFGEFNI